MKKYESLSITISYALRHAPWEYELELDDEGWVEIDDLIFSLREERMEWQALTKDDLQIMIQTSSKQRHEIMGNKIRALYGHSTPNKLNKITSIPPSILYHGTSPKIYEIIKNEGLKPMHRHYVHLSIDKKTAIEVGYRKSKNPILLSVKAEQAFKEGIKFYIGNEHVSLADDIPAKYIQII